MKIKQAIIDIIDDKAARARLSLDIGIGPEAIGQYIKANKNNGRLTKMDFLMAISRETGIEVMNLCEDPETIAQ